jgi:hypothetical protein
MTNKKDALDYQERRNEFIDYVHMIIAPHYPDLERIEKDLKRERDPTEKLLLNYLRIKFRPYKHTESEDEDLREVVEEFIVSLESKLN